MPCNASRVGRRGRAGSTLGIEVAGDASGVIGYTFGRGVAGEGYGVAPTFGVFSRSMMQLTNKNYPITKTFTKKIYLFFLFFWVVLQNLQCLFFEKNKHAELRKKNHVYTKKQFIETKKKSNQWNCLNIGRIKCLLSFAFHNTSAHEHDKYSKSDW